MKGVVPLSKFPLKKGGRADEKGVVSYNLLNSLSLRLRNKIYFLQYLIVLEIPRFKVCSRP